MFFACLNCNQPLVEEAAPFLCLQCYCNLRPAEIQPPFHSVYRYNKILRKLILAVKIEANHRAFVCLRYLLLNSATTKDLCSNADRIISAPSSFWSRMRGRFDLSWMLADALSKEHSIPMERAPWHLYWQTKKRSQLEGREAVVMPPLVTVQNAPVTILFDDVVTTGHTLRKMSEALGEMSFLYLTLGNAVTLGRREIRTRQFELES